MTASIQVKNNKYYIVLNWLKDNKRRQKWIATDLSVKGNNKRKAEAKRIEILNSFSAEKADDIYFEQLAEKSSCNMEEILFSDYLKKWLEETKQGISQNTYFSYKQTVENVICPYFEKRKILLRDLNCQEIQAFYDYKSESDGVSANTIHHYHANIHKALRFAVNDGLIKNNPSDRVLLPKKQKHFADYYTLNELKYLLENVQGTTLETVILLAAWYGLRRGEIIGLKWSSIDFKKKILYVNGTIKDKGSSGSKIENMYYEPTAKTSSSIRSFPMSEEAVRYLSELKKRQDIRKRRKKDYNHKWDEFVCVRDNGDLIPLEYVSRTFPKICEKCGLRRIKIHELRHTNISILLEAGASIKELQEWAGHSNYNVTANIYSHVQASSKIKLSKTLESVLK